MATALQDQIQFSRPVRSDEAGPFAEIDLSTHDTASCKCSSRDWKSRTGVICKGYQQPLAQTESNLNVCLHDLCTGLHGRITFHFDLLQPGFSWQYHGRGQPLVKRNTGCELIVADDGVINGMRFTIFFLLEIAMLQYGPMCNGARDGVGSRIASILRLC